MATPPDDRDPPRGPPSGVPGSVYTSSRFMPYGPVADGAPTPRGVQEPSQLDALVCGVCGLKLEFWGRSKSDQAGAPNEIWVFGCHDRHQGWEYDPVTGRWWLKERSNPVAM